MLVKTLRLPRVSSRFGFRALDAAGPAFRAAYAHHATGSFPSLLSWLAPRLSSIRSARASDFLHFCRNTLRKRGDVVRKVVGHFRKRAGCVSQLASHGIQKWFLLDRFFLWRHMMPPVVALQDPAFKKEVPALPGLPYRTP
jgi:hypothetical protein